MRRDVCRRSLRRPRASSLQVAELRRLDLDLLSLEACAKADPVLRTMLAAARACRNRVAGELVR